MSMKKYTSFFTGLLAGLFLLTAFAFTPNYFEISKQLEIFTNVFKEVSLYYVDDTAPGEMMDEAIVAMLASLDPYTNYIPEEAVEDFKIQQTGNYGGIGATIRRHEGQLLIAAPYEGFAAQKAGLKAGDIILAVNGQSALGKSTEEVSEILKGAAGTELSIKIERQGKEMTFSLKRGDVHVNSVPYSGYIDEGIGYIALSSFTQKASREIEAAWDALEKEGTLKALVLDLRNNPGGLLSEAINVTNLFIPKGKVVVETKGKMEEWQRTYETTRKARNEEIPLAVLISSGSASASEIVAGTLQDYDRALVLGQRSFGKGLVQETKQLPYGAQVKITIAKYYTPSGRLIQAIDYAERAEDGSVAKVPDSLRTRYETVGGRPVFDGGGIDPDLSLQPREAGRVILALYRDMHIFDFATRYYYQHPEPVDAKEFRLSDAEFIAFQDFLKERNFSFDTRSDKLLQRLEESTEEEGYGQKLSDDLTALTAELQLLKANDVQENAGIIKNLIEEEIVARYHYEAGRLAKTISHDREIDTVRSILQHPNRYRTFLGYQTP